MTRHELKTWPPYFDDVLAGRKTFEIRRNDRDFKLEDTLLLREWSPEPLELEKQYTGRTHEVRVCYVTKGAAFGIDPEFVVLGIAPLLVTFPKCIDRETCIAQVHDGRVALDEARAELAVCVRELKEVRAAVGPHGPIEEAMPLAKVVEQKFRVARAKIAEAEELAADRAKVWDECASLRDKLTRYVLGTEKLENHVARLKRELGESLAGRERDAAEVEMARSIFEQPRSLLDAKPGESLVGAAEKVCRELVTSIDNARALRRDLHREIAAHSTARETVKGLERIQRELALEITELSYTIGEWADATYPACHECWAPILNVEVDDHGEVISTLCERCENARHEDCFESCCMPTPRDSDDDGGEP